MVAAITRHDIKWLSPSPVWDEIGDLSSEDNRRLFVRPTILRFNKDNFMDELLAVMAYYPDRLIEWQARPETWRDPMPTPRTAARLSVAEPRSAFNKHQKRRFEVYKKAKLNIGSGIKKSNDDESPPQEELLKLYQPPHLRYYLVSASLVCRKRGLPDRVIDKGSQERVSFVLRRLVPGDADTELFACQPGQCDEYAFVQTEQGYQWRNITLDEEFAIDQLIPDEERLPMFSIGFDDLSGRKRRLVSGFIPVGKRETYLGAPLYVNTPDQSSSGGEATQEDTLAAGKREAIKSLFEIQIAAPWKAMIAQAATVREGLIQGLSDNMPGSTAEKTMATANANKVVMEAREQIQTLSWYVLLDLADFLERNLPDVWDAVLDPTLKTGLSDEKATVYDVLEGVSIDPDSYCAQDLFISPYYYIDHLTAVPAYQKSHIKPSLIEALVAIRGGRPYDEVKAATLAKQLETIELPYERDAANARDIWPPFLFPLADPWKANALPDVDVPADITDEPDRSHARIDELTRLIAGSVTELNAEAPELISFKEPDLNTRDGVFVIRCVYERPNCGPFNPPVVSEPSEVFQMASFFDPDAPGRPIRIPMPLDISPAGLRKFNKNTTFMISDMLCGKIRNIRKITFGDLVLSVLPWPFHKDLPTPSKTGPCGKPGNTFGMFCSLSIPIVTLCALILLIIMVTLFDIFFRWLPLLFVCIPLPGLKGKKP